MKTIILDFLLLPDRVSSDANPMTRTFCTGLFISLAMLIPGVAMHAQTIEKPDLSKQPTLYVVGYAHLDTEWRWEYPQVINEY
ncbi:MAG: hypothetical protein WA254_04665, partial [Candidatus Sulfotelmatobacter sp.]